MEALEMRLEEEISDAASARGFLAQVEGFTFFLHRVPFVT
jgi:hypothetical protein